MPRAWRLVKKRYEKSAFSGVGAAEVGGRWNSTGVRVVYAGEALSLAALETLVHIMPLVSLRFSYFTLHFKDDMVQTISPDELPENWQAEPPTRATQSVGDRWAEESQTAVLKVPSVVVPREFNYLLNPLHPDFDKIRIDGPESFTFDPRLSPENHSRFQH